MSRYKTAVRDDGFTVKIVWRNVARLKSTTGVDDWNGMSGQFLL